jgi:hypothetical protein
MVKRGEGQKFDGEKPRWVLLPWAQVEEVVKVLTFGAKKYAPNNWQKVEDGESRYLSACFRHTTAILRGEKIDPETGLSHYAHAICSLLFAFWHSNQEEKQNEKPSVNTRTITFRNIYSK